MSYQNSRKWIEVFLSVYFNQDYSESRIIDIGKDMLLIVNNTQSIFSKYGYFIGCVNEYLGKTFFISETGAIPAFCHYCKEYTYSYEFSDNRNQWHITLYPVGKDIMKPELYSPEEFHTDMFIIRHSSDYITEKYQLKLHTVEGSCNPEIINNIPYLTHFIRLVVFRYKVKDRYKLQNENPILDKLVLGGNMQTFYDLINQIIANEPESDWTNLVKEIIS